MSERRRELLETPEFTAQFDEIVQHHSMAVIVPVLTGLLDGIAKSPQSFERTIGSWRLARNDSIGLTIPTFRIVFQILDEGQDSEHVLLLWIQEDSTFEEIIGGYLT
jgi:hypothetical protein